MQLVGATSSYIRRPFLLKSILIGFVSGIISLALLFGLFYALNNVFDSIEISYSINAFLTLLGSLIFIGVFITYISTFFALNKYLRMKLNDLY